MAKNVDRLKGATKTAPTVPKQPLPPLVPDREVLLAQALHRHTVTMSIVGWCGRALVVGIFAIPLLTMQPMVRDLAGKTTNINAIMSVSIILNLALALSVASQMRQKKKKGEDLRRQRDRMSGLEHVIEALKGNSAAGESNGRT